MRNHELSKIDTRSHVKPRQTRFFCLSVLGLIMSLVYCIPAFAQSSLCLPGYAEQSGVVNDILPTNTVLAPWTNETPRGLRSTQTIDNVAAMRAISISSNSTFAAASTTHPLMSSPPMAYRVV